jgi:hypothetical protein
MNSTKTSAGYSGFFGSHTLVAGVLVSALVAVASVGSARACTEVSGTLTIYGTLTTDCVNVASTGRIVISGGTLILDGSAGGNTSTIDGRIELQTSGSTLRIASNSHTLAGSGYIQGQCNSACIAIGSGLTLTNQTTICGHLQIAPAQGASSTALVNDTGGLVRADGAGTLDIHPHTVSGAGDWQVSTSGSAVLQFTTGSQNLTGRFDVDNGTLNILDTVCTSGVLDFQGGEIDVDGNVSFSAGGSCRCEQ